MAFRVLVTDPAFADMQEAADFIWEESPGNARRWLSDCCRAIDTLAELPLRHALIPEADILGLPYRSLTLHTHRLIIGWMSSGLSSTSSGCTTVPAGH